MPTIRIDDDVYTWLKSRAVPFEDNPNSVLRRLAGLDTNKHPAIKNTKEMKGRKMVITALKTSEPRWTGKLLNDLWGVHAKHALYHKGGTFYENLCNFPGALFDYNGYKEFKTAQEYNTCPYLNIGEKLNVHHGISTIPGYKRMEVK